MQEGFLARPVVVPGYVLGRALNGNTGRTGPTKSSWRIETWARRAYRDLIYFHGVGKGGHFAAWEQPELFSEEIRAAFRPLR
jgi:pimeloyl-ACP methyl ester carboxylesterase